MSWTPTPCLSLAFPEDQVCGSKRLLAALVACNVAMAPLIFLVDRGDRVVFLIATLLGVLFAQLGILAVWTVWSPGILWHRFVLNLGSATLLLMGVFVGFFASVLYASLFEGPGVVRGNNLTHAMDDGLDAVAPMFLALPAVSLAVQSPLWVCRLLLRWQIGHASETSPEPPLSIRDLFVGTAMVAVALGCLRLAMYVLPWNDSVTQQEATGFWLSWGVAAITIVAASALLLLPLVALIFRSDWLSGAIIGTSVFIAGAGGVSWIALVTIGAFSGMPFLPVIALLSVSAMVVSMLATLALPLLMAHHQGFRLRIGRGSPSHPPPLHPSS